MDWNGSRLDLDSPVGGYESWFMRGNHPTRPLAFWIRYTIFRPKGAPAGAGDGELWAVWFDGEAQKTAFAYSALPLAKCSFAKAGLDARIGTAVLSDRALAGEAAGDARISWDLVYEKPAPALLLYPERMYAGSFPRAKVVTPAPGAVFRGALTVNGVAQAIDGWAGSQSHNWGPLHTERYAWGQVAGFDDAPDAFLECATARVRIGPLLTPPLTVAVLRVDGREIALGSPLRSLLARATWSERRWELRTAAGGIRISATFEAPEERFAVLSYRNPPGGAKTCRNSKIASCRVVLEETGKKPRVLETKDRAAFEVLS